MSASYAGVGLHQLNKIVPLNNWRTVRHHFSCIWLFLHTKMLQRLNAAENKTFSKITSKKAAEFAASDACIGCGQCARLCPPREYPHCGRAKRLSDRIMSSALAARRAPSPSVQSRKREHYHNPDITPEELTQKIIHI